MFKPNWVVTLLIKKFNEDRLPKYEAIAIHSNFSDIGCSINIVDADKKVVWATKNPKAFVDYANKLET